VPRRAGVPLRYLVAATRPWNARLFRERIAGLPGEWCFVADPAALTVERLAELAPRYVFFMHWSWKIPAEIVRRYECVVFHMTDLPYGRGGSPLQNLIEGGHRRTRISALRAVDEMDAGPVYLKRDLDLHGLAEEIYLRAAGIVAEMIEQIARDEPTPSPQSGQPTVFRRRRPADSAIPARENLERLFDFVRMLDAEGYPRAFLVHEGFRYELSRPALREGRIVADVTITPLLEGTT